MFEEAFSPFACKGLHLPNRFLMAPMTRGHSPGGVPGADVVEYYRKRAAGNVGLIITEGTGLDRLQAPASASVPRLAGEDSLEGWKHVVDAVHEAGGKIAVQIWHAGAAAHSDQGEGVAEGLVESPSGLSAPGKRRGAAMSDQDVTDTIESFVRAATAARDIGFDAIELHAAHGYLIDQFFWAEVNARSDDWGGKTLPQRSRFAQMLVKAIRTAVGPELPVLMRISQWKVSDFNARLAQSPAELEAWLGPLAEAGVDIFHCSTRRFWEPEFDGSDLNLAGWVKKLTGRPTVTVGGIGSSETFADSSGTQVDPVKKLGELMRRLERGDFDLIAVGRPLIADPDWVRKIRDGREEEIVAFDPQMLSTLS